MHTIFEAEASAARLKAALAEFAQIHFSMDNPSIVQALQITVVHSDELSFEYIHEADGISRSGGSL